MPRIAFRAVRGRKRYFTASTADRLKDLLGERMDQEVKPHFLAEFDAIVADWNHKVTFAARKYIDSNSTRLAVFPTGANKHIYEWVTKGTAGKGKGPTYPIEPKNAPALAFQLGYVPHTSPGGGYGGAGVATGEVVFAQHVDHPGITPREFEKHVATKNEGWFSKKMEAIWKWAIRRL